jgi:NAD(P)H-hydrate epimerase
VAIYDDLRMEGAEAILDALFGTGLSRPPQGDFARWILAINGSKLPVVAVDLPSGLDGDTGVAYAPTVRAQTTVTLGLPKPGLLLADGPRLAGEVWVADIGVPFEAYAALGIEVPPDLFNQSSAVRL